VKIRTARVLVDTGLGEHGVVLDLRLAQRRAVAGDQDQLGGALAQGLQGGLVAEGVLARLHAQCEAVVQRVGGLLLQKIDEKNGYQTMKIEIGNETQKANWRKRERTDFLLAAAD
jgi:hypothetical protein